MRSMLLFFLLCIWVSRAYAQKTSPPAGEAGNKISGRVADSLSKQVLEYCSITLRNQVSQKIITGTVTDGSGLFVFNNVQSGEYTLEIEFIGYVKLYRKDIAVRNGNANVSLGTLLLAKASHTLQNVTINGSRQLIENKIDKLVYNVEKDITSQGGMATDALKKIPGITVDIDGNVELLGNSSIRFLIDGKPSGIFGNSVAEALQSIPASQIQSIEVITSPGAKYDAAGTGGIINIILKKNKIEGFNGNINVTAGTRLENGSVNAGYKKNTLSLSLFFTGNAQLRASTPGGMDRVSNPSATGYTRLLQNNNFRFGRDSYKAGAAADRDISKKVNLSASIGYSHFATTNEGITRQELFSFDNTGSQVADQNSMRNSFTQTGIDVFDNSLVFKKKFSKKQQELSIGYTGSYGKDNTLYKQAQYYHIADSSFAGSRSFNPGIENEVDLFADYTHLIRENIVLECGIKTIFQSIISNADVFSFEPSNAVFRKDGTQSYASGYRRRIYAGYLSISFRFLDWLDVKAGGRIEHTQSNASYSNAAKTAIPDYNNIAPSVVISHSFSNKESVKLGYTYRIERPDFRDLNPFVNLSDPHNITTGNPQLQPEIGNNVELGYNKSFDNGTSLNLLAFYQRNSPDIKPYITYYPSYKIGDSLFTDVTLTTRANISAEVKAGMSIAAMVPAGKKVSLRTNIQLYNRHLRNIYATPSVINAFGLRVNVNATWQINSKSVAEFFGNYNLGLRWQGKQASLFSYTVAFRKQLLNNKASIGVVAVIPFSRYIHQESLQLTQDFSSNIYRDIPYRSFGISFMYKFGKLKFSKPKDSDNYLYTPPAENQ